jgi:hypothetical protein
MHFCADELNAILALIPFIGTAWFTLRTWWKTRFPKPAQKCKAKHEHSSLYRGPSIYQTTRDAKGNPR